MKKGASTHHSDCISRSRDTTGHQGMKAKEIAIISLFFINKINKITPDNKGLLRRSVFNVVCH